MPDVFRFKFAISSKFQNGHRQHFRGFRLCLARVLVCVLVFTDGSPAAMHLLAATRLVHIFLLARMLDLRGLLALLALLEDDVLADEQHHDGDLRDAEEAPDRRLLLQVLREVRAERGARQVQEQALDPALRVDAEERREHQERVDGDAGLPRLVRAVGHGHGPREVVLARVRAQLLAAQPLVRRARAEVRVALVRQAHERERPAAKQREAADQAQLVHGVPLGHRVRVLGEARVDEVREVRLLLKKAIMAVGGGWATNVSIAKYTKHAPQNAGRGTSPRANHTTVVVAGGTCNSEDGVRTGLQADVQEAQQREHLVDHRVALVEPEVLDELRGKDA